jgi:hypothetical protein
LQTLFNVLIHDFCIRRKGWWDLKFAKRYNLSRQATWVGRAVAFIVLMLSIGCGLYISPFGRASLNIEMQSKISDSSEIFYSDGDAYSPENSARELIVVGHNNLKFLLPANISSLRWDPLSIGSNIEITHVFLSVYGFKVEVGKIKISPMNDVIQRVNSTDDSIFIFMKEAVDDPQANIEINFAKVHRYLIVGSMLAGLIFAAFIVFCWQFVTSIRFLLDSVDGAIAKLFVKVRGDGFSLRETGVFIVYGAVLYIYFLSTFSLSIDDEMAALRQDPSVWVSQGRWFVYLIERFIFPQASIPFAPYLLLVVSMALSYSLLLRAHRYTLGWKEYLTFPIFCAFPVWWFISEFSSNVPALAFGLLFVCLSIYLLFAAGGDQYLSVNGGGLSNVGVVVLLACAIAAYQSLILVFITMAFGVMTVRVLRDGEGSCVFFRCVVAKFLVVCALALAAVVLYFLINAIAQYYIVADSGYTSNFVDRAAILEDPIGVLLKVLSESLLIYSGSAVRYGAEILFSSACILVATVFLLWYGRRRIFLILPLWVGVLASPFALDFMAGGHPVPMRTMIALAYVYWLASIILLSHRRSLLVILAGALVVAYEIQVMSVNSQYIASTTITQSRDRMLAEEIYQRIGVLGGRFDQNPPPKIDVYGSKESSNVYANGWSSTMQGSFFAWDGGNLRRMLYYFEVMGYGKLPFLDQAERIPLTPIFEEMPIWPDAGAVKKVGDLYLVRLGKIPDVVHAKFVR